MSLIFAVNELPTRDLREKVDSVIHEILRDRQEDEVWTFWIYASTFSLYYRVVVEALDSRWERLFFESAEAFPAAMGEWLKLNFLNSAS